MYAVMFMLTEIISKPNMRAKFSAKLILLILDFGDVMSQDKFKFTSICPHFSDNQNIESYDGLQMPCETSVILYRKSLRTLVSYVKVPLL
jgi:hypothetical protein